MLHEVIEDITEYFYEISNNNKVQIKFEIQDGGDFLLISMITEDKINSGEMVFLLNSIAKRADAKIPKRKNDFSWMVNFWSGSLIIDSISGGMV